MSPVRHTTMYFTILPVTVSSHSNPNTYCWHDKNLSLNLKLIAHVLIVKNLKRIFDIEY